ncbi:TIGR03086 family metal-binding protein [Actinomycetota bacterium]
MTGATDPGQLLGSAIDLMTEQVDAMGEQDWARPSPCEGWSGHQVLDHVTNTLIGIQGALAGGSYLASKHEDGAATGTPAEAVERWHRLAEEAKAAAADLDPAAELAGPMGSGPAEQALRIPTHDLTVHAWDLAATAGRELELPEVLRDDLDQLVHNTPPEILRSPGLFGPELPAPDGGGPTEQIMAFLGRSRPA